MIDEGQRAAFAAWAATEGITKVGFSPVTALGRTVGNVWGERDHHLVLLDREWGIWQASQASRPRTAATGPGDLADRILTQAKDPASPLSKALWGDPPDAPEACPRCRGGGLVILADLPLEGRICGGRCPCGASLGTPKDKPS